MSVNWVEQWELFAEGFRDGKAHIDLTPFGGSSVLRLLPGPGFGDLSHPTTRLMLELMQGRILGKTILDIGSGSGILGLAACLMGAKRSYGLEIDLDAIEHAKRNAELNGLTSQTCFGNTLPRKRVAGLCLMNMIFCEQKELDPKTLEKNAQGWITSGILVEQRGEYLAQAKLWGWELEEEREHLGWCGFVFSLP